MKNEEECRKNVGVPDKKAVVEKPYPHLSKEAAIDLGFVDKDGKIKWTSYLDHVNSQVNYGGKPFYDEEASAKEVRDWEEAVNRQVVNVDEATMKSRFEEWMKKYGKSYETEEEKARRYEAFKKTAIRADKANAAERRDVPFAPNGLADMTDKEYRSMQLHCCGDSDRESYIDQLNTETAHGVIIGQREVIFLKKDAKQKHQELAIRDAERRRLADKCLTEKR